MNPGGDAAEQVVRLSLEGFEVAARLSGAAAKDVALLLASVLKEQTKTRGKARLTSMLRSGKELKVFSLPAIAGGVSIAMVFHALYNLLVSESGISSYIGFVMPPIVAGLLYILYRRLSKQNVSQN